MLSRTADHLFWMSRYMERAENTARMLNVSYETSLLPQSAAAVEAGWEGILSISELLPSYLALYKNINPRDVMAFMVKDVDNPSSIISCLRAARDVGLPIWWQRHFQYCSTAQHHVYRLLLPQFPPQSRRRKCCANFVSNPQNRA
mgnify:CR=1 FL=1